MSSLALSLLGTYDSPQPMSDTATQGEHRMVDEQECYLYVLSIQRVRPALQHLKAALDNLFRLKRLFTKTAIEVSSSISKASFDFLLA